jgi:hypothetical protein
MQEAVEPEKNKGYVDMFHWFNPGTTSHPN